MNDITTANLDKKLLGLSLQDVLPEWAALLAAGGVLHKPLLAALDEVKKDLVAKGVTNAYLQQNGIEEFIRPAPDCILSVFKYAPPSAIRVIILGEDPYPSKGAGDGLAFSERISSTNRSSIDNIANCLLRQELITTIPAGAMSLSSWASQGVLLLNRYLTRTPEIVTDGKMLHIANNGSGKPANLHQKWSVFTDAVIDHLIALQQQNGTTLCIFGMGNTLKPVIERLPELANLHKFWWSHPSPRSTINNNESNPQHFIHCPHFVNINNELVMSGDRPIDWSIHTAVQQPKYTYGHLVVATDGSCKPVENGQDLISGAAAVFATKINGMATLMGGKFTKTLYGYGYRVQTPALSDVPEVTVDVDVPMHHSNQRAELMGAIIGLREVYGYMLHNPTVRPYVWLIVDNTTVIDYINYRIYDPQNIENSDNADLLQVLHHFLKLISGLYGLKSAQDLIEGFRRASFDPDNRPKYTVKWRGITVIHQRSHVSAEGLTGLQAEIHALNKLADSEANRAATAL